MGPLLGAHMSAAGGLPRAVERAVVHRCRAFQLFTKNPSRWLGRTVAREEVAEFRAKVTASGIGPVLSHAGYLINLATANSALRRQSIDAMADEIDRAERLGLLGVVLHPGCCAGGREAEGIALVADALVELLAARDRGRTMILIEHTAGQGTALGATFEQVASLLARANAPARLGVCLDTCHLLASGYDLRTPEGYIETFRQFGRLVGFERLKVFHLNDSKKPLGSHVDRHEHIGAGHLGLDPFRRILNDPRFRGLPMLLETPKSRGGTAGAVAVDPLDLRNLTTLRALVE